MRRFRKAYKVYTAVYRLIKMVKYITHGERIKFKTSLIGGGDYYDFEDSYTSEEPSFISQMHFLVKQGFIPLTTKDIMEYRIKAIQSKKDKNGWFNDEIHFWVNSHFGTVDGLVYFKGNLIVVPNSQELLSINPDSKLGVGDLVLTQEQYDKLFKNYDVLKRDKVISDKELTKKQAKLHPIWLRLAQGDKALLNEYVDLLFAKSKEVYQNNKNMDVVFLPEDQEIPVMAHWKLWNLNYLSRATTERLDCKLSKLIGVPTKNLEKVVE